MNHTEMQKIYSDTHKLDFYNQLLGEYDQMMDWESRLQRETPFFEKIFRDFRVKTILDAACGTGRHCFHFLSLGAESVVGADISEKVIELAKARAAVIGGDVQFVAAGFTELADRVTGPFNMVSVLGNSLSHLLTYDDLELSLHHFRRLLSARGIVLLHLQNWERRLKQQDRFFPPRSHPTTSGLKLFFRFLDYHEELVTMNLIIFQQDPAQMDKWTIRSSSTTLRPWRREILLMALKDAELKLEREYGGMDLSPYQPNNSPDYILIARK
jgi:SAM-dependent methyltransferase